MTLAHPRRGAGARRPAARESPTTSRSTLTATAETFRSRTTITFDCVRPGSAILRGRRRRCRCARRAERGAARDHRPPPAASLTGLAARNVLVVDGRLPVQHLRRGAAPVRRPGGRRRLPLLDDVPGRGQADVRLLRPAGPEGAVHVPRHRPARIGPVVSNAWPRRRTMTPRPAPSTSHRPSRSRRTSPRSPPGPYHRVTDTVAGPEGPIRAGSLLPRVTRPVPRRGRDLRRDQGRVRLLPPGVRLPVPVRQVRPDLRARVLRPRDGERRRGGLPGRVRLPGRGSPTPSGTCGRTRSCTSWRTCGSATWSPPGGGTTPGSTRRSPRSRRYLSLAEATRLDRRHGRAFAQQTKA